jgi:hypothetical protein
MRRRASEVLRALNEQPPLSEDEVFGGGLPQLRLKPEHAVDASESAQVVEGLRVLEETQVRNVLVRDSASGLEGVLVPVQRYVELLGRELQLSRRARALPDGRLLPSRLADSEVEMVEPDAEWPHLRRH